MSLQSDAKKALKLFNSGAWLQLEGSIGRWVNSFVDAGYFVKDEEKTNFVLEFLILIMSCYLYCNLTNIACHFIYRKVAW